MFVGVQTNPTEAAAIVGAAAAEGPITVAAVERMTGYSACGARGLIEHLAPVLNLQPSGAGAWASVPVNGAPPEVRA